MQDLRQFFTEEHFIYTRENGAYDQAQLGANITILDNENADWEDADIVIVGCESDEGATNYAADAVREELYKLYSWHHEVKIADAGNISKGSRPADTRAALRTVLHELELAGKIALVIGGAHDLTMQQYDAYKKSEKVINLTIADMLIDMEDSEGLSDKNFLMELLTAQPSFIRHYSHIGFQSYYVHPKILETLDKLRFDFYRLGMAREHLEDMEPVLRSSDVFSFDISTIRHSDAPANKQGSPNGFTGDEACQLARYAGMSDKLHSFGIFGLNSENDVEGLTARQLAQMIWYFADGCYLRKSEAKFTDHEEYLSFDVTFTDNDTQFLKSKRTNRWWMKLPSGTYTPCSYKDYQLASNGEIPERWLREQERLV